ncbi:MAG: hypothetical protein ACOH2D_13605 [Gelidibacter sp.]
MKKIVMIIIAVATLQVSAQEQKREVRKQRMESKTSYSPEEMAQLQAKKMTLILDLSDKQQKEMSAVFLEQAKLRQSKKEAYLKSKEKAEVKTWSKEERFKMANARLDQQIEMKKKMKSILSSEQYEKWGKMNEKRDQHSKRYARHSKNKSRQMTPKEVIK